MSDEVNKLIKKATETSDAPAALHWSQSALNAAHALQVLAEIERTKPK